MILMEVCRCSRLPYHDVRPGSPVAKCPQCGGVRLVDGPGEYTVADFTPPGMGIDVSEIAAAAKREHDARVEAALRSFVDAGIPLADIVIEKRRDGSTVVRVRRPDEERAS